MTPEQEEALFEAWWANFTTGTQHKEIGKSLARHVFLKGLQAKNEKEGS